jgi:ESCO1/2 acetyl-transferase
MSYNKIDPNDIALHKKHHAAVLSGPTFPTPLGCNRTETLLVISRSSSKELQKRGLLLLDTVDVALGAPQNMSRDTFFRRDGKIFTFIHGNRIISLVAAERISFGYRRVPGDSAGVEVSLEPQRGTIGISRMWTCIAQRGKGYCTRLLDQCAKEFVFGVDYSLRRELVGFTSPSESGLAVARKWTGREDFLVYDDTVAKEKDDQCQVEATM